MVSMTTKASYEPNFYSYSIAIFSLIISDSPRGSGTVAPLWYLSNRSGGIKYNIQNTWWLPSENANGHVLLLSE